MSPLSSKLRFPVLLGAVMIAAFLLSLYPPAAYGQLIQGSITGQVTDQTGAAVPDAEISAMNTNTGEQRSATTNAVGQYNFPTVPTGIYNVTVTKEGFRSYIEEGIQVSINTTVRVDVALQVGQVAEQITVSADAATLQTDRSEVRAEVSARELENVPIPLNRNYQMLIGAMPGVSVPENAHSVPSNPSRAVRFSVNGTSRSNNNTRIDGASQTNVWLPHMTAYTPALESIETVNVVTNSFDAEQGLAGGAAINLSIKTGTNQIHGVAFWYNNNQHFNAYPYFSDPNEPKPKFIYNNIGGTIGGPIVKNRVFYFVSYERTTEHTNEQRFVDVPTQAMRQGDLSSSPYPVFNPFTGIQGDADGAGREPFPGNIVPKSMWQEPSTIMTTDSRWPLPNFTGSGDLGLARNYLGSGKYFFDRDVMDSKMNFVMSDKITSFARFSYLDYRMFNPQVFGEFGGNRLHRTNSNPGKGFGFTASGTWSTTYVVSPNLVFDGYFGFTWQDTNVAQLGLDKNIGRDFLKIPGTNGTREFEGGWPRIRFDGLEQLGISNNFMPYFRSDPQWQIVGNGNWTRGRHEIRFGTDLYWQSLNHEQPEFPGAIGPASGGFRVRDDTTSQAGTKFTEYNTMATFLLGLVRDSGRIMQYPKEYFTRTSLLSAYVRDRVQATSRLTLNIGLRWEGYPYPTRKNRGLERWLPDTNQMMVCGVGSEPKKCGLGLKENFIAPRLGLAYRATDTLVIRAGYGMTIDPFNWARPMRTNYPIMFVQNFNAANSRSWITTFEDGLPEAPPAPSGGLIPMPLDAALTYIDKNADRGYIQSWNLTLEKQLPGNWLVSAGYVATRSVRFFQRFDANWSPINGGKAGKQMVRRWNRNATTTFYGTLGTTKYDSLQVRAEKRFSAGMMMQINYTWANNRGFGGSTDSGSGINVDIPEYYSKNRGSVLDYRHVFNWLGLVEVPFGKGKRYATEGAGAAILGGWQFNWLTRWQTGREVTPTASGASLNAPGSGQFADCLSPMKKIGSTDMWWDKSTLADPNDDPVNPHRFGTCGTGVWQGPGMINFDLGLFRKFQITERMDLQFRAESFNISNTPHFRNPSANVTSTSFGVVRGLQNTGREGIDQRVFRLGLRLGW